MSTPPPTDTLPRKLHDARLSAQVALHNALRQEVPLDCIKVSQEAAPTHVVTLILGARVARNILDTDPATPGSDQDLANALLRQQISCHVTAEVATSTLCIELTTVSDVFNFAAYILMCQPSGCAAA